MKKNNEQLFYTICKGNTITVMTKADNDIMLSLKTFVIINWLNNDERIKRMDW